MVSVLAARPPGPTRFAAASDRLVARLAATVSAGALLLVAGCSTPVTPAPRGPSISSDGGGQAAARTATEPARPPSGLDGLAPSPPPGAPAGTGVTRGGGYYLDDGPGARPLAEVMELAARPDPVPVAEPLHPRANRPYRVMGNDYRPMTRRAAFVEQGIASWYGRRFHGNPTSIGERYDMYAMTAAHPTLPIPSYARVTSLENGRSVIVRVNDRGPFLHGRVIDLSFLAAYKLGYVEAGSAPVRVELLDPREEAPLQQVRAAGVRPQVVRTGFRMADETGTARVADAVAVDPADAGQVHLLQLGAFRARENAQAAADRLARQLAPLQVRVHMTQQDGLYRIQAGPYGARDDAVRAGEQVRALTGLSPMVVQGTAEAEASGIQ